MHRAAGCARTSCCCALSYASSAAPAPGVRLRQKLCDLSAFSPPGALHICPSAAPSLPRNPVMMLCSTRSPPKGISSKVSTCSTSNTTMHYLYTMHYFLLLLYHYALFGAGVKHTTCSLGQQPDWGMIGRTAKHLMQWARVHSPCILTRDAASPPAACAPEWAPASHG